MQLEQRLRWERSHCRPVRLGHDLQLWLVMQCPCWLCCVDPGHVWSGCSRNWSVLRDRSGSKYVRRSWRCLYRRCLYHRCLCHFQRAFSFRMLRWYDCPFCSMCICASGVRFIIHLRVRHLVCHRHSHCHDPDFRHGSVGPLQWMHLWFLWLGSFARHVRGSHPHSAGPWEWGSAVQGFGWSFHMNWIG